MKWKLTPEEPTEEMKRDGFEAVLNTDVICQDDLWHTIEMQTTAGADAYRQMLRSAPTAPDGLYDVRDGTATRVEADVKRIARVIAKAQYRRVFPISGSKDANAESYADLRWERWMPIARAVLRALGEERND